MTGINIAGGRPLPQFISDLIASPPRSGEGLHLYLFRLALVLHPWRTDEEIFQILHVVTLECGRTVLDREIRDAIANSRAYAWTPGQSAPARKTPTWPPVKPEIIRAVVADGISLVDLWEASPIRFIENYPHTEEIIDALFPGEALLCCAESQSVFATRTREDWRGKLCGLQLIVPSPMVSKTGLTRDGRESAHALANTGPRRFLVIECDFAEKSRDGKQDTSLAPLIRELATLGITVADICAGVLAHLGESAPLALVVHSGGKSLHGWFYCENQSENTLRRFMTRAVRLGADPITWTRSQFVRMPDGLRPAIQGAKQQSVFYFNPAAIQQ